MMGIELFRGSLKVTTSPAGVAVATNSDKIADAISGAFDPNPPPQTPAGAVAFIVSGIIGETEK